MSEPKKRFATSVLSRSSKLLKTAARVAGQEAAGRLSGVERVARRIEQARAVTEQLRHLKGAVMKAGQLLSIDAGDFLPPEAVEILGTLQDDAEPVEFEVVESVLVDAFGADWRDHFEHFEETSFAAASIGQVHRARVNGAPVVVKVQYPGVAESIDADLAMLARLANSWLTVTRKKIDLTTLFDELSRILHREADYVIERENLERYAAMVANDDRFVVPRAYPELSTERVLTMSFEQGAPVREWMKRSPSFERRIDFARAMLDLYCVEFFEHGFVQTDPNPANFLVREDGKIVLLDFGAALEYDATFRERYVALLKSLATRDPQRTVDEALTFGLLDEREKEATMLAFVEMLESAVEPFASGLQPFEFADADYLARAQEISARFTRALEYSPPPRQLLFLHRKLGGLFNLLKRMEVRLDLAPYWDRMVGVARPAAQVA